MSSVGSYDTEAISKFRRSRAPQRTRQRLHRVDWFTPRLPTWGDAAHHPRHRGHIELRKYLDIEGRPAPTICSCPITRAPATSMRGPAAQLFSKLCQRRRQPHGKPRCRSSTPSRLPWPWKRRRWRKGCRHEPHRPRHHRLGPAANAHKSLLTSRASMSAGPPVAARPG